MGLAQVGVIRMNRRITWKHISFAMMFICACLVTWILFSIGWILPRDKVDVAILTIGYVCVITAALYGITKLIIKE